MRRLIGLGEVESSFPITKVKTRVFSTSNYSTFSADFHFNLSRSIVLQKNPFDGKRKYIY
jgi:hypothetical protein